MAQDERTKYFDWLREQGYTHVLVNWLEVYRLRDSDYGFPTVISEDLFARLTRAGLTPVKPIIHPVFYRPYGMVYRVPGPTEASAGS